MIPIEEITQRARRLWTDYEERDPRRLCKLLDIRIEEMPMGLEADSIKGLILKSSRCCCIVLNSDLDPREQDFIILHEIGHIVLGHADIAPCACRNLFYNKETAAMEIEANEFVAEYVLNTEETLQTLKETNSYFDTARILCVPPAVLHFKWRVLKYYKLLSQECPIYSDSDCMGKLGTPESFNM